MPGSNRVLQSAAVLLALCLASICACAQRLQAQSVDLASMGIEDLMNIKVTSVSRTEQKLSRVAAAVFVITQEEIRRSGAMNISDARVCTGRCRSGSIGARRRGLDLHLAGARVFAAGTISAQQARTEYQVKAAFLLQFLKFVEWPDGLPKDFNGRWVIGIVGDNPIGNELNRLGLGQVVQGRNIQVRRILTGEDPRACHILFIGDSEKWRLPSILTSLRGSSVLVVADMGHFIESGEMIQVTSEDSHIRLVIDVGAKSTARLKVVSKLLFLARTVTSAELGGSN
jgi:YfiR/HmsC-like